MKRPRIAWFTPLQPVESGISLYSEEILPLLAGTLDIDVFVDGYRPATLCETSSLKVFSISSFDSSLYDATIYQVGNSPAHDYMLPLISSDPGILVLHDTVLNHLFIQSAAMAGDLEAYRRTMHERYGDAGRSAADRVLKGQAPDDLFRFPMSEPLIEASRATIVHSEFALDQVTSWVPSANVSHVPHGLNVPVVISKADARRYLAIPADQFLVVSVTHINPYKRLDSVLRAFRRVRQRIPARMVLAGSISPNYPIQRTIAHLGLDQVVDLPGYVSDDEARLLNAAADVIVNLRYPTAGETSGSLLHAMSAGRPVLVSETGSFTEAPPDTVIRVPVDQLEEEMIVAVLECLYHSPRIGEQIGEAARTFIESTHSLQAWVDGYLTAIETVTGHPIQRPTISAHPVDVLKHVEQVDQPVDPVWESVAADISELGIGADEALLLTVARSCVELGLGVGMIKQDVDLVSNFQENENDDTERQTDK